MGLFMAVVNNKCKSEMFGGFKISPFLPLSSESFWMDTVKLSSGGQYINMLPLASSVDAHLIKTKSLNRG